MALKKNGVAIKIMRKFLVSVSCAERVSLYLIYGYSKNIEKHPKSFVTKFYTLPVNNMYTGHVI